MVTSVLGLRPSEALWCSIRLSSTRVISSSALSAASCGSSPLSLSCQLCSEGESLDGGRAAGGGASLTAAPRCLAAASLTLVSEQATLSTLITAQSVEPDSLCVHSVTGEAAGVVEGASLSAGDGVCALLEEEAGKDKAMAVSSASEGVVGGVWKKSRGEPERGEQAVKQRRRKREREVKEEQQLT